MALISFLPNSTKDSPSIPTPHSQSTTNNKKSKNIKKIKRQPLPPPPPPPPPKSSSWDQLKSLLSCKNASTTVVLPSQVHAPSPIKNPNKTKHARLGSTCGSSICAIRDVVHTTTRVTDHGSTSSDSGSHVNDTTPLSAARSRGGGGGMQLMKLSGCYECHAVDAHSASRRYPRPRTLCPCTECGEVFTKSESLELHQAIRHAVSELGPEDSGRNIVEIIFKSSWQKKDTPICTIERILKVHNTQRTITRFEDYRDAVKARAQAHLPAQPKSKNPRCAADGNELLRFHCTSISCSLGSNASTSLCLSSTGACPCSVCTIIRYGFSRAQQPMNGPTGVRTTASSGRAHDWGPQVECGPGGARRAMLVCRVIAGRVERNGDETEGSGPFDSVAGDGSLEELFVANPRAILPCFVVIYNALD